MRIVFMGSPDFAVLPLQALVRAGHDVACVVTQPDKKRNRGVMQPTPVKAMALELGLNVIAPERIKTAETVELLRAFQADLFVVVAYGQLLSEDVLALPRYGAINIHASLLPAYRGSAPIHHAILDGQSRSGVSIMYLDKGMDSGDVIVSRAMDIGCNETTGELYDRMCETGTQLMLEAVDMIDKGIAPRIPQDHAAATYAPMIKKEHEVIDWNRPAVELHNQIRALNPAPGAYTMLEDKRLKLWSSCVDDMAMPQDARAGMVVSIGPDSMWVCCGSGVLRLDVVQPQNKSRMAAGAFARGYHVEKGTLLG